MTCKQKRIIRDLGECVGQLERVNLDEGDKHMITLYKNVIDDEFNMKNIYDKLVEIKKEYHNVCDAKYSEFNEWREFLHLINMVMNYIYYSCTSRDETVANVSCYIKKKYEHMDEATVNIIRGMAMFITELGIVEACIPISIILHEAFRNNGIKSELKVGYVLRNTLKVYFRHLWVTVDDTIVDIVFYDLPFSDNHDVVKYSGLVNTLSETYTDKYRSLFDTESEIAEQNENERLINLYKMSPDKFFHELEKISPLFYAAWKIMCKQSP